MLIACYTFGWFALLADEYQQLSKHIASGATFISNFALLNEAGYFDNSAETKPLLHLWSLGIEEQFYILWPALIWLAHKCKFNLLIITLVVALISFALNMKGIKEDPVATFYSPQTRFWEILCGSLLAWVSLNGKNTVSAIKMRFCDWLSATIYFKKKEAAGEALPTILSLVGLIALSYGFWRLDKDFSFPGYWAVIPVLSTMLIIFAGPNAWINRVVLSNRTVVWFGLISFPLYLWHWPLLSFARIVEGDAPVRNVRMAAVGLSILLAWLTYKVVENRIRLGDNGKFKVTALVLLMAICGSIGYVTHLKNGLVFRFGYLAPQYKNEIEKIANAWKFRVYPEPEGSFLDKKYGFLRIGKNEKKVILFVGDSHLRQYWNTLGKMYRDAGNNRDEKPSVLFTDPGFPPDPKDRQFHLAPAINAVVFSYYWSIKYGSSSVNQAVRCCGTGKNGTVGYSKFPIRTPKEMNEIDFKLESYVNSLKRAGKDVYFVLDNPFGEEIDPRSMLERSFSGFIFREPTQLSRDVALSRTEPARSRIMKIAENTNSVVIDPFEILCDSAHCPAFSTEGELIYKDYDHLSLFTSINKVSYLNILYN